MDQNGHFSYADEEGTKVAFLSFDFPEYLDGIDKKKADYNREYAYAFKREMDDDATIRDIVSEKIVIFCFHIFSTFYSITVNRTTPLQGT